MVMSRLLLIRDSVDKCCCLCDKVAFAINMSDRGALTLIFILLKKFPFLFLDQLVGTR
jgi:hypothetical protein